MATRLYGAFDYPTTVSPPDGDADNGNAPWTHRSFLFTRGALTIKASTWGTTSVSTDRRAGAGEHQQLVLKWVSQPLKDDTTISGTATAMFAALENASGSDANGQLVLKVVSYDGQTQRGMLYAGKTGALVDEFTTSRIGHFFPADAYAGVSLTSVDALAGDRVVIEVGIHYYAIGSNVMTGEGIAVNGSPGTDFSGWGQADTRVSWVELSTDLVFADEAHLRISPVTAASPLVVEKFSDAHLTVDPVTSASGISITPSIPIAIRFTGSGDPQGDAGTFLLPLPIVARVSTHAHLSYRGPLGALPLPEPADETNPGQSEGIVIRPLMGLIIQPYNPQPTISGGKPI
jgi:hypothetical protein